MESQGESEQVSNRPSLMIKDDIVSLPKDVFEHEEVVRLFRQ